MLGFREGEAVLNRHRRVEGHRGCRENGGTRQQNAACHFLVINFLTASSTNASCGSAPSISTSSFTTVFGTPVTV